MSAQTPNTAETIPHPSGGAFPLAETLQAFNEEATFGVLETRRLTIRYFTWGSGPDLVFIHGLAERASSFAPIISRLQTSYRCVAMELANGRDDQAPIRKYTHREYVEDLYHLLNYLDIQEASLFASSFGSIVGLHALADEPGRFQRAILQGAFARRPLRSPELWLARFGQFLPGTLGSLPGRQKALDMIDLPQMAGASPEMLEFMIANGGDTPARVAALRGLLLSRLDLRPLLPRIEQPVLLLGGNKDLTVPREYELELLAGLPNARRVEFQPAGHFLQYTHPVECAEATRAFLQSA